MTTQLQQVIKAARALTPRDRLELVQVISRDLQETFAFADEAAQFWTLRTIEDIAEEQVAPVVTDISALAVDFWPEDETADDINKFVADRRHTDRIRDI